MREAEIEIEGRAFLTGASAEPRRRNGSTSVRIFRAGARLNCGAPRNRAISTFSGSGFENRVWPECSFIAAQVESSAARVIPPSPPLRPADRQGDPDALLRDDYEFLRRHEWQYLRHHARLFMIFSMRSHYPHAAGGWNGWRSVIPSACDDRSKVRAASLIQRKRRRAICFPSSSTAIRTRCRALDPDRQ